MSGAEQPTGQGFVVAQGAGFFRENDEDGLRDLFRVMRIAGLPERNGIDEVHVARHQGGEGLAGIVPVYWRNNALSSVDCIRK